MSNTYETPATNVTMAALKLLRHKMLVKIASGSKYPSLDMEDINESLIVAGLPVIVPEEVLAPQVEVINVEKEDE